MNKKIINTDTIIKDLQEKNKKLKIEVETLKTMMQFYKDCAEQYKQSAKSLIKHI